MLWGVYFALDGFDLGAGALMPFLARSEGEKRAVYNAIGPFWDGNEVWLVAAGGVTFAAFPGTYAVLFSALYSPLMLILFALIVRGAALGMRSEVDSPIWRSVWDACFFAGSVLPALLFGVAFANIFRGIPIDGEGVYHGTILALLNPYGLLGGLLLLLLFAAHGALWLAVKCDGALQARAASAARWTWTAALAMTAIFLVATALATDLFCNYLLAPPLSVIPLLVVAGLVLEGASIFKGDWLRGWYGSAATILFVTLFGVIGMYPELLPSSLTPEAGLSIYNSASSPLTLTIMLVVVAVFLPLVVIYQSWVYRVFKGKGSGESQSCEGVH